MDDTSGQEPVNEWRPSGWYRVVGDDGRLWIETHNQTDAARVWNGAPRGSRLEMQWVRNGIEWREMV